MSLFDTYVTFNSILPSVPAIQLSSTLKQLVKEYLTHVATTTTSPIKTKLNAKLLSGAVFKLNDIVKTRGVRIIVGGGSGYQALGYAADKSNFDQASKFTILAHPSGTGYTLWPADASRFGGHVGGWPFYQGIKGNGASQSSRYWASGQNGQNFGDTGYKWEVDGFLGELTDDTFGIRFYGTSGGYGTVGKKMYMYGRTLSGGELMGNFNEWRSNHNERRYDGNFNLLMVEYPKMLVEQALMARKSLPLYSKLMRYVCLPGQNLTTSDSAVINSIINGLAAGQNECNSYWATYCLTGDNYLKPECACAGVPDDKMPASLEGLDPSTKQSVKQAYSKRGCYSTACQTGGVAYPYFPSKDVCPSLQVCIQNPTILASAESEISDINLSCSQTSTSESTAITNNNDGNPTSNTESASATDDKKKSFDEDGEKPVDESNNKALKIMLIIFAVVIALVTGGAVLYMLFKSDDSPETYQRKSELYRSDMSSPAVPYSSNGELYPAVPY
jgi:hypothetical protein